MPLLLNNDDQERSITPLEAVDAIEHGYQMWRQGDAIRRGAVWNILPTTRPHEILLFGSCEGGLKGDGYYAMRMQPQVARIPGPGRERVTYTVRPGYHGGLVFLFSTDNAELKAILNEGFVQHLRVAATGAAGARHLARRDSKVLGIIGSGGMARTFAMTMPAVRPIERVVVWSPNSEHVEAYAEQMREKVDAEFVVLPGPREVCEAADILCCCTNSFTPIVEPDWIKPGTHLNNVLPGELLTVYPKLDVAGLLARKTPLQLNGFQDADFRLSMENMSWVGGTPEEREQVPRGLSAPVTYPNARIVDCIDPGTGASYADQRSADEITYLANVSYGTMPGDANSSNGPQGIQFATVGGKIYERAAELGLGRELPLDWFLESTYTYSPGAWREKRTASTAST
jgi:alanine dehydrogenase